MNIKRYTDELLDTDSGDRTIGKGSFVNNSGFRWNGNTVNGKGRLQSSMGFKLLNNPYLPEGTNINIGKLGSEANGFIFIFNWNQPGDHGIYMYDTAAKAFYIVLLDSQVTGGLLFDKDSLIDIGGIVGNMLYWTMGGQPMRINFMAGIKTNQNGYGTAVLPYSLPIDPMVITLVRKAPIWPLSVMKRTTSPASTIVPNNAFRFFYNYIYRDFERSTFSEHSPLVPYNFTDETYDTVQVNIPFAESISQDVQTIQVGVIYPDGGKAFIIKTWDRSNANDLAAINLHNSSTTELYFLYFNDVAGEAIDQPDIDKLSDAVPLTCGTMEIAKDRLHLGNLTLGYDAPKVSSLSLQSGQIPPTSGLRRIFKSDSSYQGCITFFDGENRECGTMTSPDIRTRTLERNYSADFLTNTMVWSLSNANAPNEIPLFAKYATIGLSNAFRADFFLQSRASQVMYTKKDDSELYILDGSIANYSTSNTGIAFRVDYLESYGLGYSYQEGDIAKLYINGFGTVNSLAIIAQTGNYIICELANVGSLTTDTQMLFEIYTPRPQSATTQLFERAQRIAINSPGTAQRTYGALTGSFNGDCYLLTRKAANRMYFTVQTDDSSDDGLSRLSMVLTGQDYVDTGYTAQTQAAEGYGSWDGTNNQPFYRNNSTTLLPINDITINIQGSITVTGDATIPFWMVVSTNRNTSPSSAYQAQTFIVPTTTIAAGVPQTFDFNVDVNVPAGSNAQMYRLEMNNNKSLTVHVKQSFIVVSCQPVNSNAGYFVEAMSPNDRYWKNWFTDAGRPMPVDPIGQTVQPTTMAWSDTVIQGSRSNGLSTFDGLNNLQLAIELGRIQKLMLTSKVQEEGTVMLAVGSSETASLYLGETQLVDNSGDSVLAQSNGVIGTVNVMKGSYGTMAKESIARFKGNVYWVDQLNGRAISYSDNGLFPISQYLVERFWKSFCADYNGQSMASVEALGNRPFLFGGIDPANGEYVISVPKILVNPPRGNCSRSDGSQFTYPYDMYDGQAKTVAYKLDMQPNRWQGSLPYNAEGFVELYNTMYSFSGGQLWQHDSADVPNCNFYGVQHQPYLSIVENGGAPSMLKMWQRTALESNAIPVYTHVRSESPNVQESDLETSDWDTLEGVQYAFILRDMFSAGFNDGISALYSGDDMLCPALRMCMFFDVSQGAAWVDYFNNSFVQSYGHGV